MQNVPSMVFDSVLGTSYLFLTLLWWRSLSYRNQSIDLWGRSEGWSLYDRELRHQLNLKVYFTNYSIVFTKDFEPVFTLTSIRNDYDLKSIVKSPIILTI